MNKITETDARYYIDKSTNPEAGLGLFAKVDLKAGDHIEVIGVLLKDTTHICTRYGDRYKFMAPDREHVILPCGFAGIINHTDDPKLQNCALCDMGKSYKKRNPDSTSIVYMFTRDIAAGEELWGNYNNGADTAKQYFKDVKTAQENQPAWDRFLALDLYGLNASLLKRPG